MNADPESKGRGGAVTKGERMVCYKSFLGIQSHTLSMCFLLCYDIPDTVFELATHICSRDLLTRAQSRSTASNTSSWCPILATPSSSRSWCVIFNNCSPLIFSRSKLLTYCCRLSSKPGDEKGKYRDSLDKQSVDQSATVQLSFPRAVWPQYKKYIVPT